MTIYIMLNLKVLNLTKIKIILPWSLAVRRGSVDCIQRLFLHLRYRITVENFDWNIFCVWIHTADEDRLLRYGHVDRLKNQFKNYIKEKVMIEKRNYEDLLKSTILPLV